MTFYIKETEIFKVSISIWYQVVIPQQIQRESLIGWPLSPDLL